MTTVTTLPLRPDGWTVEDLDLLPDDDLRYELFEGSLLVSPPPPNPHNLVVNELGHLLHGVLPRDWVVLTPGSLEGDVYRETGRYDDEVALDEPVSLRFRLADLLP